MGFGNVFGATPAVESASSRLKLFNLLEGAPIEMANSNLKPLTLLRFSSTDEYSGFIPFLEGFEGGWL
jgi:hypothetical protein